MSRPEICLVFKRDFLVAKGYQLCRAEKWQLADYARLMEN